MNVSLHGSADDVDGCGCVFLGDDLVAILDVSKSAAGWDCLNGDFMGDRTFYKNTENTNV